MSAGRAGRDRRRGLRAAVLRAPEAREAAEHGREDHVDRARHGRYARRAVARGSVSRAVARLRALDRARSVRSRRTIASATLCGSTA